MGPVGCTATSECGALGSDTAKRGTWGGAEIESLPDGLVAFDPRWASLLRPVAPRSSRTRSLLLQVVALARDDVPDAASGVGDVAAVARDEMDVEMEASDCAIMAPWKPSLR
jgi:hypothetical protein